MSVHPSGLKSNWQKSSLELPPMPSPELVSPRAMRPPLACALRISLQKGSARLRYTVLVKRPSHNQKELSRFFLQKPMIRRSHPIVQRQPTLQSVMIYWREVLSGCKTSFESALQPGLSIQPVPKRKRKCLHAFDQIHDCFRTLHEGSRPYASRLTFALHHATVAWRLMDFRGAIACSSGRGARLRLAP